MSEAKKVDKIIDHQGVDFPWKKKAIKGDDKQS